MSWPVAVVLARDREPRQARVALVCCALATLVFAAIFLRRGLLDWGASEN